MKILFVGDYSNLHACLAKELSRHGHDVTVVSDRGGFLNTEADITLQRHPGATGGLRYLFNVFSIMPRLEGYDVVQLINPSFLKLRPGKTSYFFRELKKRNRSIFLTLAGNDHFFVKACLDGKTFRYSQFRIGSERSDFSFANPSNEYEWMQRDLARLTSMVYDQVDGAMSVLPEYDMAARPLLGDRLIFTNLPVELSSLPFKQIKPDGKVTLFIGLSNGREVEKGTDRLLHMAHSLEKRFPGKCIVEAVRNLPLNEYIVRMSRSDIVLDQLYSYSPATNALQAMALGRVTASGSQPEYYTYIGENRRPIIDANPLDINRLESELASLIYDPARLAEMSLCGRQLVELHNDVTKVASRFERHWNDILGK